MNFKKIAVFKNRSSVFFFIYFALFFDQFGSSCVEKAGHTHLIVGGYLVLVLFYVVQMGWRLKFTLFVFKLY